MSLNKNCEICETQYLVIFEKKGFKTYTLETLLAL